MVYALEKTLIYDLSVNSKYQYKWMCTSTEFYEILISLLNTYIPIRYPVKAQKFHISYKTYHFKNI